MKKPILVSLPVHEKPEVVVNQRANIAKFLPGACVVIHISQGFKGDPKPIEDLQSLSSMWTLVNPERLQTMWAGMIQAHLANFRWIKSWGGLESFSHIALHASNDMFVKSGADDYIHTHECGVQQFAAPPNMMWTPRRRARHDFQLKRIMDEIGANDVVGSQVEGTFYTVPLFNEINTLFEKHFDLNEIKPYLTKNDLDESNTLYAREEIYFSTMVSKLCSNPVRPYLFSEVMSGVKITPPLVDQIRNGTLELGSCFEKRICDPPYRLYDPNHLYAVKRVIRHLDDPLRKYIGGLE